MTKGLSLDAFDGERAAADARLEEVVARYGPYISEIVARVTPLNLGVQRSEIEQETILRLWRSLRNEREIRDLRSYVYRIAATAALTAVREVRKRHEEQLVPDAMTDMSDTSSFSGTPAASPEALLIQKSIMGRIRALLEELPRNRCRAVKLHLLGLTSDDVAAANGWSEAKARNLIYRGLAELRERLKAAGIKNDIS